MPDQAWLKQLLHASVQDGRLISMDPQGVQAQAHYRFLNVVPDLLSEAEEACALFNDLRLEARATNATEATPGPTASRIAGDLRVLPLGKDLTDPAARGLMLLLGSLNLTLELQGNVLVAAATRVIDFQKETRPLYQFRAQMDPFGSLGWVWSGAAGVLFSNEMIIKKLLEDLILIALDSQHAGGATNK
jgi:hypothetical protein